MEKAIIIEDVDQCGTWTAAAPLVMFSHKPISITAYLSNWDSPLGAPWSILPVDRTREVVDMQRPMKRSKSWMWLKQTLAGLVPSFGGAESAGVRTLRSVSCIVVEALGNVE